MSYLYDEDDDGDYSNSLNYNHLNNSYKYQNFSDEDDLERYVDPNLPKPPRLLLMGLRRSGKSSIQKVVFHKLAPNETLFLESTSKITKGKVTSFIDFQVWDFPGQVDFFDSTFDSEAIFGEVGTVVYVIDAQDDYVDSLGKLHDIIVRAHEVNKLMTFEIFVHKVDGLSDDYKVDLQRDIQQRIVDELADVGLEHEVQLSFYLTSIYDHSIFEAFSKVVQKMIRQLPTLEHLLNALCANSGIEKAYLFDVTSKIYIATDTSPVDMYSYEICADMIDVVVDLANIYKSPSPPLSPQLEPTTNGASSDDKEGSYSSIQLNSGLVLYFREINKYLALVCLLRNDTFEKRGLIDYNFLCFKKAILEVLKVRDNSLQLLQNDSNQP